MIPRLCSAVGGGRVRPVGDDRFGTGPRPAPVKPGDPDVGQHRLQRRPVVTLPAGDDERQRPAVPVDPGMNLGAQPATRPSDAVTCRFTLRQGLILVVRDCPRVLFRAGRVRRMLVGAGDRGIHADPPANFPGSIRLGQQPAQHPVPGAVPGVAAVALRHRLPRTEHVPRQVTPGSPGPIPVDDSLHHLAVVAERVARRPAFDGNNGSIRSHCSSLNARNRDPVLVTRPGCRPPRHRYGRHALARASPRRAPGPRR